jgi:hypothetical protein
VRHSLLREAVIFVPLLLGLVPLLLVLFPPLLGLFALAPVLFPPLLSGDCVPVLVGLNTTQVAANLGKSILDRPENPLVILDDCA